MSVISEEDYAAMSWHARARYNERLAAEKRALEAELAQLQADLKNIRRRRADPIDPGPDYHANLAAANRILAAMTRDPNWLAHQEHAGAA